MAAVSSLDICREGEIDCPVCSSDHIEPFLEAGVTPLWSYYCTAQDFLVSNRFMAMPSARCRIYGAQILPTAHFHPVIHSWCIRERTENRRNLSA